jgi:hypothetical protein
VTKFTRKFDLDRIEELLKEPENAWFCDLLKCWRPSGDRVPESETQADHLRLAVRNGYLNFYRAGQSIANVRRVGGKLQTKIHKKYVFGKDAPGKDYVQIADGGFIDPAGLPVRYCEAFLRDWIRAASDGGYAKEEKSFVDKLVAKNPGVIDLEAGLPADPEISQEKSAKRIDLVALEACGDRFRLVFWEAKLVTNSEARSRTVPRVFEQLKNYSCWLAKHHDEVRDAYQHTCKVLVRLHAIAKALSPNICDLGDAIVTVAKQDGSQLGLDTRPRLIINDANNNAAFMEHGHLDKLREQGFQVRMVRSCEDWTL